MTVHQANQQDTQSKVTTMPKKTYTKDRTVSTTIDGYKLVIKPDPEKKDKVDIFITATKDAKPVCLDHNANLLTLKVTNGNNPETHTPIEFNGVTIDDINFEGSKSTRFGNLNISGELDIVMDSSSGDVTSIDLENSSVGEAISISTADGDETVTLNEVKTPDLYIGVGKGEDKVSIQGGKIGRALTKGADTREINANIESINDDD
jgi:hypothetical protein